MAGLLRAAHLPESTRHGARFHPRFHFQEERFGDVVTRASISLVALLTPTAILAALGFRRLRYFSIVW
jgi:hypothetical protein